MRPAETGLRSALMAEDRQAELSTGQLIQLATAVELQIPWSVGCATLSSHRRPPITLFDVA
jgi:hypothetical protein